MKTSQKMNLIGQALLLAATLVWGTSFVILKDTISKVPPMFVIAIRFLGAGVILALIFIKKLRSINRRSLLRGVIVGLFLAAAYITQTYGLMFTTPGRNAFVTSSYVVMCPFMLWIMFGKKPTIKNIISAVICIVGIGLIALSGDEQAGESALFGDGLTLVGAVFFGLQIVFISRFQAKGEDSIILLIFEFLTAGLIFAIISFTAEMSYYGIEAYALNGDTLFNIIYLLLACTLFAQSAQMIGQKYTATNQSALILSLESVFGMLFSVIMGVEKITLVLGVGFAVVFVAILISEIQIEKRKIN